MKKNAAATAAGIRSDSSPSPFDLSDLKSAIHDHSLFFDCLVDLIPARFYLPADDDKPWFQGLSKAAKASAKRQSRDNLKQARRARLDPQAPARSTLVQLTKTLNSNNNDDGVVEEKSMSVCDDHTRKVTYEELRERLHRRIEELRSGRNNSNREKKRINNNYKSKRKRIDDDVAIAAKKAKKEDDDVAVEKISDISFGQVKIGQGKKKKSKKITKERALTKAKKLEEAKKDPEKGEKIANKQSWKAAVSRAAGEKVHDDPRLLKESIKKEKKEKLKHAAKWKERMENVKKLKGEKQKMRSENIKERIHQKKLRRIEKREKKLMRPGFEGRKEGYINE